MQRYKILIFGRGAVASMLATRLGACGQKVLMASRHMNTGVQYTTLDLPKHPNAVTSTVNVYPAEHDELPEADLIILCNKYYQLQTTFFEIVSKYSPNTPVLLIQNGIIEDLIEPRKNDYICVLESVCQLIKPLHAYQSVSSKIHIPLSCPPEIISILQSSGLTVDTHSNMLPVRLQKLLFASTSAWMAIRNLSIEETFRIFPPDQDFSGLIKESCDILSEESRAQSSTSGVSLIKETAKKILEWKCFQNLPLDDRPSYTSLHQDLERRCGKTEVMSINGKLCELGKRHSISIKHNSRLVRIVNQAASLRITPSECAANKIYLS